MESRRLRNHAEQAAAQWLVAQVRSSDAHRSSGWGMEPVTPVDGSAPDANAATWIGVFEDHELVGCLRQSGRVDGQFELETLHRLPRFLAQEPHTVEITRVAVRPGSAEGDILTVLFQFSMAYGRAHGHSYHFTTGPYPRPGKLYVDVLGMQLHGKPLHQAGVDGTPLYLYYLDLRR